MNTTAEEIVKCRVIIMSSSTKVLLSVILLVLVGCEEKSFSALGCEWQRPQGYTDSPNRKGFERLVPGSRTAAPSIRYYESDPGRLGNLVSDDLVGSLSIQHYKVADDARYSAGVESVLVRRQDYIGRIAIVEESLETFLMDCQ